MPRVMSVGVIGYGSRAQVTRHVRHATTPAEVVAICDINRRGQADARKDHPEAMVTDDPRAVINRVDAVFVLTPDDLHAEVVIAALEAGVHVFCEKPMAITINQCDAMLTAARRTGSRLYVGHNMRHMPVITQMRGLIQSGRIGDVKAIWCRHFVGNGGDFYFKNWNADRRHSTSLLLQKGAHDIDVIHWLADGYSQRVLAMGDLMIYGDITDRSDRPDRRVGDWLSENNWPPATLVRLNPIVDVEDISMMIMQLNNGVLASYQQCHFTPDYWRNYTVIGSAGRIENLGDEQGAHIAIWDRRHLGYAEPDELIEIVGGEGGHGGADPLLIDEFLRFASQGGQTQTSPIAARMAVATGYTAAHSLRNGGSASTVPGLANDLIAYFNNGQME